MVGCLGLVGNMLCVQTFAQKSPLKCFHHLMLSLAGFDSLYILMAILLFGLVNFLILYDEIIILFI